MSSVPFQRTWLSPQITEHFNYRRDPAFMEEERVPNVNTAGMPSAADIAKNNGVPPIAIPYMALQNLSRQDGTGKRIIVPMVVGFESTFLANSLQGLLCLPGCESVFMGEPVSTDPAAMAGAAVEQRDEDTLMNTNEEEAAGILMDEGGAPSVRSFSSPPPSGPVASGERAASHTSGTPSLRSPSSNGSDSNSLGPSGELDAMTTEEAVDNAGRDADSFLPHGNNANGGNNNGKGTGGRKGIRVLRGGIRCHGSVRMKTAVSRTYANFVLQHLEDAEIQLKTPATRSTSTEAVSDRQLDAVAELETLRGQTPNVPRCLAPVALVEERRESAAWRGGLTSPDSNGGLSSSPLPLQHASSAAMAGGESGNSAAVVGHNHNHHNNSNVSVSTKVSDAEKLLLTTSEHSCSDNSPTPSSGDGDEEGVEGHSGDESGNSRASNQDQQHHHHRTVSAHAMARRETRVDLPMVARDGRRFTCFASNSIENMPEYHFPRLESDDLVELTAFMVARSSVQPDEAVDLDLATHILGDPQSVALMPYEMRNALINRAARLMEAAVFLQI